MSCTLHRSWAPSKGGACRCNKKHQEPCSAIAHTCCDCPFTCCCHGPAAYRAPWQLHYIAPRWQLPWQALATPLHRSGTTPHQQHIGAHTQQEATALLTYLGPPAMLVHCPLTQAALSHPSAQAAAAALDDKHALHGKQHGPLLAAEPPGRGTYTQTHALTSSASNKSPTTVVHQPSTTPIQCTGLGHSCSQQALCTQPVSTRSAHTNDSCTERLPSHPHHLAALLAPPS